LKINDTLLRFLGMNTQGDVGPWTFYTSKRNGLVWFVKAPPLEPPSRLQTKQRNRFRLVAAVWRSLGSQRREVWKVACERAYLQITPYNFFTYYLMSGDEHAVRTVENQSGTSLLPLSGGPP